MKVYIESVWGDKFRLNICGSHEYVRGTVWNRATSIEALNLIESVYHIKRESVRFLFHGKYLA